MILAYANSPVKSFFRFFFEGQKEQRPRQVGGKVQRVKDGPRLPQRRESFPHPAGGQRQEEDGRRGKGRTAGGTQEEGSPRGEDHPRQHVRQPAPAEQPRRAGEGLAQPQAVEPVQPCRPGQQEDIGTGQNRERMTRAAMTPSTTMRNTMPGLMGSAGGEGAGAGAGGTKGAAQGTSLPELSSRTSPSR